MSYIQLNRNIKSSEALPCFNRLYGLKDSGYAHQMSRYCSLVKRHEDLFNNDNSLCIVSAPGRSEIIGNHTDHNDGRVLAAAINLDAVACIAKREDMTVNLVSEGYPSIQVDLNDLTPNTAEAGTTASLVRGVAAGMKERGYQIGGFDAVVSSDVLSGSGLSSSAAFEVLVCAAMDQLYNGFVIDSTLRAKIAQYAENEFFMKPCGLMDQMACSTGGLVAIDFKHDDPEIEPVAFSFADHGYALVVINTGGSHDDLTDEYAAIRKEMNAAAHCFGEKVLRSIHFEQFMKEIARVRKDAGDRAVLRSLHYYDENERVLKAVKALRSSDLEGFFKAINESGVSSWTLLQNIWAHAHEQQLAVSLATAKHLMGDQGANRVHGGGFAGTTLHFVPQDMTDHFTHEMEKIFGEDSVHVLDVRPVGAVVAFTA